jgi:hypothetical protein
VRIDSSFGSDTAVGIHRRVRNFNANQYRPLKSDRAEVLSIREPVFRSVEDSVRSIVPTNLSTCSDDASSIRSFDDGELSYIPYAFEDMLFTSYVYKRNFRTNRMHFRQVRQRPEIINGKLAIEGSIAQIDNVSRDVGVSQTSAISLASVVCGSSSLVDATVCSEHSRGLVSTTASTEDPHNHPSDMELASCYDKSEHEPPVSVESTAVVDSRISVANIHTNVSTVDLHTATEGAVYQGVEIERRPPSSVRTWQNYLESAGNMSDSSLAQLLLGHSQTGFELEESSIEQAIRLISQFNQDDLEAARKWDQIETVLLEYMLMIWLRKGDFAMPNWTQCVANAATYRELAEISGILHRTPTALQLACATKNSVVVEYLLSSGCPLIPLDWRVHPFILATKRRCKIILELFLKLANNSVSQVIRNYALAMVINQDCALSENALYLDQNDNKRIGADVNIVSFLLANGSSPNLTVQGGISVLSLAIQAAHSSNPFSLQIVEILLRRGANFGSQEQDFMAQGPLKAFGMLKQRHKINSPTQQTAIQSRLSRWPRVDTIMHGVVLDTAHDDQQFVAIDHERDWRRLPLPSGVLANVPEPSRLDAIWFDAL